MLLCSWNWIWIRDAKSIRNHHDVTINHCLSLLCCMWFMKCKQLWPNCHILKTHKAKVLMLISCLVIGDKQRVLMHGHQGWNVRYGLSHLHEICIYIYIYIWVVYSLCFFCCLFITVTWWYVWCIEWASGNQEEVQACLVTLWLFITSCYSLYKTTLGLLSLWFENNPQFHKYSMDFHV